ncbi:MAG: initiation control protein YabA [Clostridiales bacterium]
MSISKEFKEWEEKLASLLLEGQMLRRRVEEIERQNLILQEKLTKEDMKSGGLEALKSLYEDGFHICHAHFAQPREEDCLFCLSFLLREGVETDKNP